MIDIETRELLQDPTASADSLTYESASIANRHYGTRDIPV